MRAAIGYGRDGAALGHQFGRAIGHINERVAGNIKRLLEARTGRFREPAGQILFLCKCDGMNQKIERAPFLFDRLKGAIKRGVILHVCIHSQGGPDTFRERCEALSKGFTLIGEGQFSALFGQLSGNPPCDGFIVGHAEDKPAFAFHFTAHGSHPILVLLLAIALTVGGIGSRGAGIFMSFRGCFGGMIQTDSTS